MANNQTVTSEEKTGRKPITRSDVEALAAAEGQPVLKILSLLQTGASHLNDGEQVLDELCAIKAEILGLGYAP